MYVFNFLGNISKSGTSGSYGNFLFNFLRNQDTVFQSGCTILHFHRPRMRVPVSPQPRQHLLLSVFFIVAILTFVKWCHITTRVCISLIAFSLVCLSFVFPHLLFCISDLRTAIFCGTSTPRIGNSWVLGRGNPGFASSLCFYQL